MWYTQNGKEDITMGLDIMYLRWKENNCIKNWLMVIVAILVLMVGSGCSIQDEQETEDDDLGTNLKEIHQGAKQFSKLKNGTLELNISIKSENHAVQSLVNGSVEGTSLITFISNRKGYDYLQETKQQDEETGEIQYSAFKQVNGSYFTTLPAEQGNNERTSLYDWADVSEKGKNYNEPNGVLKTMTGQVEILKNQDYIGTITKEKDGALTKYTLTTNDAFAKYAKDFHSAEENYTVIRHYEMYWTEDGILIKQRTYDKFKWTIDDAEGTYISDATIELAGYNYKTLKKVGNEIPPMIMFNGKIYTRSKVVTDINTDSLVQIGTIKRMVGSVQKPERNNQANRLIKNAKLYKSGKNGILVKDIDYALYQTE